MSRHPSDVTLRPAQLIAERVFSAIERFLHIEAVSGIVLMITAAAALIWANSPAAASYHHLWETKLSIGVGERTAQLSLHHLINDGLMAVFFFLVGLEIKRGPRSLVARFGGVGLNAPGCRRCISQADRYFGWSGRQPRSNCK